MSRKGGESLEYMRSPPNAVLLHRGEDAALRVRVPRPERAGVYSVELRDAESGALVASGTFRLM
ncbi:MAG: hypothetical protein E2P02_11285 [Acidobacteria bacterium]|nr:MAG: hypothetical protein E2P02_11285 [Acidobacteriota bacterium]